MPICIKVGGSKELIEKHVITISIAELPNDMVEPESEGDV